MGFAIDTFALWLLFGCLFLIGLLKFFVFRTPASVPSLAFSRVQELQYPSWRSQLSFLPSMIHYAGLVAFIFAFLDPHFLLPRTSSSGSSKSHLLTMPSEGVAIYFVLDQSGSMAQAVSNGAKSIPKIDLLKQVTKEFIQNDPSDMIGLVSFARIPRVLVPLTLDHDTLLHQLIDLQVVKTPDEDGTAIGYAIYKAAHLIEATRYYSQSLTGDERPPYTIKSAVIVVVTDGFQDPSHLDQGNLLRTMELDDAAAYAKSQNIRLYVINIDPALATSEYAPQRRLLQKITAITGGQFYLASDTQQLHDIYKQIDKLEKGSFAKEVQVKQSEKNADVSRFSLYPFFIAVGLLCLFFALVIDLCVFRTIP